MRPTAPATLFAAALLAASPGAATAQFKLPGGLGGAIPGVGTAGIGNAAGLLGYCLKNRLLGAGTAAGIPPGPATPATPAAGAGAGAAGAAALLGRLTGRSGVTQSPGFALGQQGQVQQSGGGTLSLGALPARVKTQACNLVLQRAGSFL